MTLATAALLTLTPTVLAVPQASPAPRDSSSTPVASTGWMVVTADAVNVRSGPSAQSSYAFGKLRKGDLVRVLKDEYGWARVEATGPAFGEFSGYVPADRRVTLAADRSSAKVTARTELRAPNADAGGAPDKSWKQIGHLEPGASLTVLGVVDGEKESVYKVRLPQSAEGWVNMQFLRAATDAEIAAGSKPATPAPTAPAAAPTKPATTAGATGGNAVVAPSGGETAPVGTVTPVNAAPAGAEMPAAVQSGGDSPAIPPLRGVKENADPAPAPAATSTTTDSGVIVERTPSGGTKLSRTTVSHRTTLNGLEDQFKAVRAQPEAGAEFAALQAKYKELMESDELGAGSKAIAKARAQQLGLLIETQTQMQELQRVKSAVENNRQEISKALTDLQNRADYTAVGVLNASAVYDGTHLPELYRVCDPMTGATIAYVLPNPAIPMPTMLTTLVGVKGGSEYDPALRLQIISPVKIDIMSRRDTPQVTRVDPTQPAGALAGQVPAKVKSAEPAAPAAQPAPAPAATPEAEPCPDGFEPAVPPTTSP